MAKFKYIGNGRVRKDKSGREHTLPANCMGGHLLKPGDIVELTGDLERKADLMPNSYQRINESQKKTETLSLRRRDSGANGTTP